MAFPKRVDANQKVIVKTARDLGASVLILSMVGKGCPDILMGVNGINALIEIKDGDKSVSARKLTECEQKFFDSWEGQVCIISTITELIDLINRMRSRR